MAKIYSLAEEQFVDECLKATNRKILHNFFVLTETENGEKRFQLVPMTSKFTTEENLVLLATPRAITHWKEAAGFGQLSIKGAANNFKQIIRKQIDEANRNIEFQKSLVRKEK